MNEDSLDFMVWANYSKTRLIDPILPGATMWILGVWWLPSTSKQHGPTRVRNLPPLREYRQVSVGTRVSEIENIVFATSHEQCRDARKDPICDSRFIVLNHLDDSEIVFISCVWKEIGASYSKFWYSEREIPPSDINDSRSGQLHFWIHRERRVISREITSPLTVGTCILQPLKLESETPCENYYASLVLHEIFKLVFCIHEV